MLTASFRFAIAVGVVASSLLALHVAEAHGEDARPLADAHQARGVVKGFGPERRSVSIAHEAIPGFMAAMTMSFDAASADQLRELAVGDRVRFSFAVTGDGRRVLASIVRETPPR